MSDTKTVGRPPTFKTPLELEEKILEYLEKQITDNKPLTISGLCYYCGFESRQSFYAYEKKEEFSYTIKKARLAIEIAYEEMLHDKYPTGAIFALKNLGWTDQQHFKHDVSYSDMTDDELLNRINKVITSRGKD